MQYCDHHDAKSVIFCESPVVVGASLPSVNLGVYIPIFWHSTTYLERCYFECWYFEPLPIFFSFSIPFSSARNTSTRNINLGSQLQHQL